MTTLVGPSPDEVADYFGSRAAQIDDGSISAREGLARLGALGSLGLGAPSNGDGRLPEMSRLLASVAERSMASAFSLWAHRMVVEYVLLADAERDTATLAERLLSGELPGATAMAAALQDELGLGSLGVSFERRGEELILDGKVRWASNLFDDGFLVVLAAADAEGRRVVVALPSDIEGLSVDPYPDLLALGATASSSLTLAGVVVDDRHVLTHDVAEFLQAMRGPFLLLQSSFCLGLARAALAEVSTRLTGVNSTFDSTFANLEQRRGAVESALGTLCDRTTWSAVRRDVLSLRLEAATLAQDAVALEARVQGGAGYLQHSATARRLREAAFLPIQSPTEGLLRWELSCSTS